MDAFVIAPFHDKATGRSSILARMLLTVLRREGFEITSLEGEECTRETLRSLVVDRFKNGADPIDLIIYCGHGETDYLLGQEGGDEALIDLENIGDFGGSAFIALSCLSGKKLGPASISHGVRSFISFKDFLFLPEIVWDTRNFQADFLRTLLLLPLLISKGHSVKYSIDEYKELCEEYVKKYRQEKYLFAEDAISWLNNNLKGITYNGLPDVTIKPKFVI